MLRDAESLQVVEERSDRKRIADEWRSWLSQSSPCKASAPLLPPTGGSQLAEWPERCVHGMLSK